MPGTTPSHLVRARGLATAVLLVTAACGGDGGSSWVGMPGAAPMTLLDWTPSLEVLVDGVPHAMILDTGAPFTALDRERFPGRVDGLAPASVALLGIEEPRLRVSTFDLFGPGGPVDGLVGSDVLGQFALALDYRASTAAFLEDGTLAPAPDDSVPVELAARIGGGGLAAIPGCGLSCGTRFLAPSRVLVRARVEGLGEPVWALVDTGASGVLVREGLLARLDAAEARARPRLEGIRVAAVAGVVSGAYVRLWRVALADAVDALPALAPSVAVDDVWAMDLPGLGLFESLSAEVGLEVDLLIGGSYLRAAQVVVDLPNDVLRLAPYATRPHVPEGEFARVGFTLARSGDAWVIEEVRDGSDAEAVGLAAGDRLDAVDGAPVLGLDVAAVDALFVPFGAGDAVPLTVTDLAGAVREVEVRVEDLLPSFPPPG